jgi:hypothetical protein
MKPSIPNTEERKEERRIEKSKGEDRVVEGMRRRG